MKLPDWPEFATAGSVPRPGEMEMGMIAGNVGILVERIAEWVNRRS